MYPLEKKKEKNLTLMYTMYTNTSNNTPSYTHVSLYVVWRVHPGGDTLCKQLTRPTTRDIVHI